MTDLKHGMTSMLVLFPYPLQPSTKLLTLRSLETGLTSFFVFFFVHGTIAQFGARSEGPYSIWALCLHTRSLSHPSHLDGIHSHLALPSVPFWALFVLVPSPSAFAFHLPLCPVFFLIAVRFWFGFSPFRPRQGVAPATT